MLCFTLYIVHPVLFSVCQVRYPGRYIDGHNFDIIDDIETAEACWEVFQIGLSSDLRIVKSYEGRLI